MLKPEGSLSDGLPADLDWQGCTGLLLDAVRLIKLSRQLEQWTNPWVFEPLYTAAHMAGLEDLSPRVVKVEGPQQAVLQQFLAEADEEWGYLLFCDGTWQELMDHLRWLTVVRMPYGEDVLLRLADPALAHGLLGRAVEAGDPTLFGPCHQVLLADGALDGWHLHQRPGPAPTARHGTLYALSAPEVEVFETVSFRNAVMLLKTHMQHYFPAYLEHVPLAGRWERLNDLATTAYARGFNSELDITLYANIHGYLGEDALNAHPDLESLLSFGSTLTPSQRVEKVAEIARCRALGLQEPT